MTRLFENLSDNSLLESYENTQEALGGLRREIETRMLSRNSIAIPSATFVCEMPVRFTYYQEQFAPLKEVLSESELAGCWKPAWSETIPEHVEEHPEAWATVKLLAVAKRHGDAAMKVVEAARQEARGNLTFRRREERA